MSVRIYADKTKKCQDAVALNRSGTHNKSTHCKICTECSQKRSCLVNMTTTVQHRAGHIFPKHGFIEGWVAGTQTPWNCSST